MILYNCKKLILKYFQGHKLNVNIKNFEDVKAVYNSLPAWGILSSLDIRNCSLDLITNKEYVERFAVELCDLIGKAAEFATKFFKGDDFDINVLFRK